MLRPYHSGIAQLISFLFLADERAALAAAFFNETDLADRHLAVDGFAHVVDRKASDGHGRHGLHLDAGVTADANRGFDIDAGRLFLRREFDFRRSDVERVAHGD